MRWAPFTKPKAPGSKSGGICPRTQPCISPQPPEASQQSPTLRWGLCLNARDSSCGWGCSHIYVFSSLGLWRPPNPSCPANGRISTCPSAAGCSWLPFPTARRGHLSGLIRKRLQLCALQCCHTAPRQAPSPPVPAVPALPHPASHSHRFVPRSPIPIPKEGCIFFLFFIFPRYFFTSKSQLEPGLNNPIMKNPVSE